MAACLNLPKCTSEQSLEQLELLTEEAGNGPALSRMKLLNCCKICW